MSPAGSVGVHWQVANEVPEMVNWVEADTIETLAACQKRHRSLTRINMLEWLNEVSVVRPVAAIRFWFPLGRIRLKGDSQAIGKRMFERSTYGLASASAQAAPLKRGQTSVFACIPATNASVIGRSLLRVHEYSRKSGT
jgi:hypothetical protein